MKYDVSLCLAGIRPQFWKNLYDSIRKSCTRYSWELVVVSPFKLPSELKEDNIKYINEFGNPVRATQMGISVCEGKTVACPCDDGFYTPGSIDQAMDLWNAKNCGVTGMLKNCLVCRYREGSGFMELGDRSPSFPTSYWNMNHHLNVPGTQPHWKIAPQPMVGLEYLKHIGGFDCNNFECMSMATWDLCCRIQRDGGGFYLSPTDMMIASNVGAHGHESSQEASIGGHSAIYYAQTQHDYPRFMEMQSNPEIRNNIRIDFDNWKLSPEVWSRRWGNKTAKECYDSVNLI